jgi:hypothetical protein
MIARAELWLLLPQPVTNARESKATQKLDFRIIVTFPFPIDASGRKTYATRHFIQVSVLIWYYFLPEGMKVP